MDWSIPSDVQQLLVDIDEFIERELKPLEEANPELFDHRREFTRTDVERGGIPTERWREMMAEARRRSIAAGFYKLPFPTTVGGSELSNLTMAVVREHLAKRGPGLHAELSHEASVVANQPIVLVLGEYGTDEQKRRYMEPLANGEIEIAFGLTEPDHGSDATWLETTAEKVDGGWVINGAKRWNSVMDVAAANLVFARTSGQVGKAAGISAFLVPGGHGRDGGRLLPLDLQHADRPRGDVAEGLLRAGRRDARRRGPRARLRAAVRAREPDPPGRLVARRGTVLHRRRDRSTRRSG